MNRIKSKVAFTLIELLVVITVINILSSIILVSASSARQKARLVRRATDIRTIQKALELYNLRNNVYPDTGGSWQSACGGIWGSPIDPWIPNLVPEFIRVLPTDPLMDPVTGNSCYAYRSDSTNYKLISYNVTEFSQTDYLSQSQLIDPRRDGGSDNCSVDSSSGIFAWAIYTRGACIW